MKKKIDIDKKNGLVTVTIELPKRNSANDPILSFYTNDVKILLESEGVSANICRKKDSISNQNPKDSREGTWVFQIKKQPQSKQAPQRKKLANKKESLTTKARTGNITNTRSNSSPNQRKIEE